MNLHKNKEMMNMMVRSAADYYRINQALVEKDYYVTLILKKAMEKIPGLVFKGGTSLSKCYKIINRFSEDIDLTLDNDHFSISKKRDANKQIIKVCEELELKISNLEEIMSRRNYNCYNISYPKENEFYLLKPEIKVEIVFIQKSFPIEKKPINSIIGKFLLDKKYYDLIQEYELSPFIVNVQSLERTLIDKVFAICDYYFKNKSERNSRHIYDIYYLVNNVKIDDCFKKLFDEVREERKKNKSCISLQAKMPIRNILEIIINTEFYKKDYYHNTLNLIRNDIQYEEAIKGVKRLIESSVLDD